MSRPLSQVQEEIWVGEDCICTDETWDEGRLVVEVGFDGLDPFCYEGEGRGA